MFLIYPRICDYCGDNVLKKKRFCALCQTHFTLLDPKQHCPFCFSEQEGVCSECVKNKRFRIRIASACDHFGAVTSLASQVRQGLQVKLAVSLLSIQFFRLGWETPDCVIPIPSRGNISFSKAFSRSIGVGYEPILKRGHHVLPQMRLPWAERMKLPQDCFFLKGSVQGKRVLLVDDLLGTGTTLRVAAAQLREAKQVFALTLSRLPSP